MSPIRSMARPARVAALGLLALAATACGGRPAEQAAAPPWPTPSPVGADDPRRAVIGEWVESGPPQWTAAAREQPRPRGGRPCRRRLVFTADSVFEVVSEGRHDQSLGLFTAARAPGGLELTVYRSASPGTRPETARVRLDGDRLRLDGDDRTYVRAAPLDGRILAGTWFEGDLRAKLAAEGDWTKATLARQAALDGLLLNHDDMRVITPDLRQTDGRARRGRLVVLDAHGPERCVVFVTPGSGFDTGHVDHLRREGDRLIDDGDVWVSAAYRRETLAGLAAAGFRVPRIVAPAMPDALLRSPWAEAPDAPPTTPPDARAAPAAGPTP